MGDKAVTLALAGFIMMAIPVGYVFIVWIVWPLIDWVLTLTWNLETLTMTIGVIGLVLFLIGIAFIDDNQGRWKN